MTRCAGMLSVRSACLWGNSHISEASTVVKVRITLFVHLKQRFLLVRHVETRGVGDMWHNRHLAVTARFSAIPPWCNGSTRVFGTLCLGSSPGGGAHSQTALRRMPQSQFFFIFLERT